jgi:glycerol-3-phosphate acyltransferase PlsY
MHFKVGKGVASTFGIAWMLNPLYALVVTVYAAIARLPHENGRYRIPDGSVCILNSVTVIPLHNTPFVVPLLFCSC